MKNLLYFFPCLLLFSCLTKEKADLIVHNSKIISVDQFDSFYEAMAIKNGKIIALGKENQILA